MIEPSVECLAPGIDRFRLWSRELDDVSHVSPLERLAAKYHYVAPRRNPKVAMRGWGKVKRRHDGWQVDIHLGPERVRLSYPTKQLATDALADLRSRKATGKPLAGFAPDATYSEVLDKLLDSYAAAGHTARTLRSYESDLRRVRRFWQDRQIARTRRGDIEEFVRSMRAEGLSASTIRHALDRLSQAHQWALDNELIDSLPCPVPRPSLRESLPGPATPEDALAQMLAGPDGPGKVAVLLAADAGLRRSEILALRDGDVDLDAGTIRVLGKGGRVRVVPILTDRLTIALRPYTGRSGPLLGCRSREVLDRVTRPVWRMAYPGRNPRFHELRRRFATVALGAGATADEVRRALGHGSLTVTDRYNRERPATWRDEVRRALSGH